MSKLTRRKRRAIFEAAATVHDSGKSRPVCGELLPDRLEIWLKATRRRYALDWELVYDVAMKRALIAAAAARRAEKKARVRP